MKKHLLTLFLVITSLFFLSAAPKNEHLKYGCPSCNGSTLYRTGYVLCHDNQKKVPLWVIYHLTKDELNGPEKRKNYKFLPDPDLPVGQRAENSDYRKSGYDRGHMCPAADQAYSKTTMKECFYLSNMCPQWPQLNRRPWKYLEDEVRVLTEKYGEAWIFVGPIFKKDSKGQYIPKEKIGYNNVWVPWGFYKIIVLKTNEKLLALAFEYKNEEETNDFYTHLVTIDEIESQTGLNFLNALSENEQNQLESIKLNKEEFNRILIRK